MTNVTVSLLMTDQGRTQLNDFFSRGICPVQSYDYQAAIPPTTFTVNYDYMTSIH